MPSIDLWISSDCWRPTKLTPSTESVQGSQNVLLMPNVDRIVLPNRLGISKLLSRAQAQEEVRHHPQRRNQKFASSSQFCVFLNACSYPDITFFPGSVAPALWREKSDFQEATLESCILEHELIDFNMCQTFPTPLSLL